ncbi:MAG TPA: tryptophan 7-halogenase, partial [Steroidobacteraceae bacterium]|nr:tryptophan 7-halogenase [Steroidobacteraceae bacterium]
FRSHGRILREDTELFPIMSWLAVMVGQNIIPQRYDPLVDGLDTRRIQLRLDELRKDIRRCVAAMPSHWDYLQNGRGDGQPATASR